MSCCPVLVADVMLTIVGCKCYTVLLMSCCQLLVADAMIPIVGFCHTVRYWLFIVVITDVVLYVGLHVVDVMQNHYRCLVFLLLIADFMFSM